MSNVKEFLEGEAGLEELDESSEDLRSRLDNSTILKAIDKQLVLESDLSNNGQANVQDLLMVFADIASSNESTFDLNKALNRLAVEGVIEKPATSSTVSIEGEDALQVQATGTIELSDFYKQVLNK